MPNLVLDHGVLLGFGYLEQNNKLILRLEREAVLRDSLSFFKTSFKD